MDQRIIATALENEANEPPAAGYDTRPMNAFNIMAVANGARKQRTVALSILRLLLRLAFIAAAARIVGGLVMSETVPPWLFGALPVLLALSALASSFADKVQADDEAHVAQAVRIAIEQRLSNLTARQVQSIPVGKLVVALQRYPDALAGLVIGHRAGASMMVVGPLLAASVLSLVSWQAALTVLALTPVMILFFVVIGGTIRKAADAQEAAFGHLAGQFADRIRTLPTILANHALDREERKLAASLRTYADRTMRVLRIAFLNSGIIDFFASLSIAMLAVFLGLGHLGLAHIPGFSGLALWESLFILMVAPEYFAPFRRYAEQYHVKSEGDAAAIALDQLLSPSAVEPPVAALDADLPATGLVAVTGPSGSGKTTFLRKLAGVDKPTANHPLLWASTDSYIPEGTLSNAIGWNTDEVGEAQIRRAATDLDLLDPEHLPDGLNTQLAAGGANLSGGQRLRIAIARAMLSRRTMLADEPTAKLDPLNAQRVRDALLSLAKDRLVVVATHDEQLARLAARRIEMTPGAGANA